MSLFSTIFASPATRRIERAGFALYTQTVRAARLPIYYAVWGVPDTLDGRFDLVGLFVAVLIRRLRLESKPGPALAQAVFDAMFADMDTNLREMGVSDMAVGKRVREMWEGFHGRALAYETALSTHDEALLAEALARNVWRGETQGRGAGGLARHILVVQAHLAAQNLADLAAGRIEFPDPEGTKND
jgi:cytochrome b pre-mRNA-processing protein 3